VQEQEAIKKVQDDQKSLQQQLEKERAMRAKAEAEAAAARKSLE
jgi:hypothetical protein